MVFDRKRSLGALILVLVLSVAGSAGEERSSLIGAVRDSNGAPLDQARVELLAGGLLLRTVTTNASGRYELDDLAPGMYTILVHLAGFAPALIQELTVSPQALLRGDFDLRSLEELPGPEAPIWRLRAWRGHILREQNEPESPTTAPVWSASASNPPAAPQPVSAELRLLSRVSLDGSADAESLIPQAQISLASLNDASWGWSVRGLLPGNERPWFRTQGTFHSLLTADHQIEISALAARLPFRSLDSVDRSLADEVTLASWVTSLAAEDRWIASEQWSLTYGLGLEHYQYRSGHDLLTPRVGLQYQPPMGGDLEASVSMSGSGPGKERVADELFQELREFSGPADLQPERQLRFEAGYSRSFSPSDRIRLIAFRSQIDDNLLGIRGGTVDPERPGYQLVNLGDQNRTGLELSFRRRLVRQVVGEVVYRYAIVEDEPFGQQRLRLVWPGLELLPGKNDWHDVSTAIDAHIPQTGTRILAHYRWNSGYPGVLAPDAEDNPFSSFSRVDLSVAQSFPVRGLDELDWEALVGIQNLFNNPRAGLLDFGDQPTLDAPRQIVGGLGLKF